ncbi:MAG: DUF2807 domain-containing protein [Oscillospiraceae bacterium]|jgi:hypothetical protein|nr:DUF2807 domain-containing protein [Oscillospiraceae bacterium]
MKNRRWLALALALCMVLPLAACGLKPAAPWPSLREGGSLMRGNGNVVEQKTPIPDDERGYSLRITGISLRGSSGSEPSIKLIIDESLPREVVLTTDENIAACISVSCDAGAGEMGAVVIDLTRRVVFTPTKLTIAVGAPVRALDINGAWNFTYDCPGVTACKASINGAANGKFTFGALDSLRVDVNGTGDITLAGAAARADLTINGAANIRAFGLAAEAARVAINGTGNCDITATGTLSAEINGLGNVVYGGDPVVKKQIHGLGAVKAR